LAGILGGYRLWSDARTEKNLAEARKYALVTAQVWVASARFRNDSTTFLAWRDSALAANGLSKQKMTEYLEIHKDRAEDYYKFAELVNRYVDSLYRLLEKSPEKKGISPADSARRGG
jgi:hypothetical protein